MVGTAYLSAEPGSKPFASIGQTVAAGDTLPELWQQADRYRTREESQDSAQGRRGAGATT